MVSFSFKSGDMRLSVFLRALTPSSFFFLFFPSWGLLFFYPSVPVSSRPCFFASVYIGAKEKNSIIPTCVHLISSVPGVFYLRALAWAHVNFFLPFLLSFVPFLSFISREKKSSNFSSSPFSNKKAFFTLFRWKGRKNHFSISSPMVIFFPFENFFVGKKFERNRLEMSVFS